MAPETPVTSFAELTVNSPVAVSSASFDWKVNLYVAAFDVVMVSSIAVASVAIVVTRTLRIMHLLPRPEVIFGR
jgi:hypothetical protein